MTLAIYLVVCFLLGAIPFAYIIPKLSKGIDIRTLGSKNPGATNVRRILGWKYGIVVLFLDALKGFLALYCIRFFFPHEPIDSAKNIQLLGGLCSVLGHTYSPFLLFRGGKGVATSLGVFLYLAPYSSILAILVFFLSLSISRIVSVGTIVAMFFLPCIYYTLSYLEMIHFSPLLLSIMILIFFLILIRHRSNIKRILSGNEFKVTSKRMLPQAKLDNKPRI
ncbi:MAG: glycerol-3-phosphate 1-O-acyltransferase PlsY [Spirochaetota bacterium]